MSKKKNKSSDSEYALVYSTDPKPQKYCPSCRRIEAECRCKKEAFVFSGKLNPSFNIERKGRGGKSVTIIGRLPAHQTLLKDLLKYLKSSLGCGGTFYTEGAEGFLEIQGEQQDKIKQLIASYNNRS